MNSVLVQSVIHLQSSSRHQVRTSSFGVAMSDCSSEGIVQASTINKSLQSQIQNRFHSFKPHQAVSFLASSSVQPSFSAPTHLASPPPWDLCSIRPTRLEASRQIRMRLYITREMKIAEVYLVVNTVLKEMFIDYFNPFLR